MRSPLRATRAIQSLLLVTILTCIQNLTFGQTIPITYDIPPGLEKDISPEHYHLLVDTSVEVVEERYQIESVKGGTIQLAKGQQLSAFNLDNLILKCAAVKDTTAWPAIIRTHFNQIFKSVDDERPKLDLANYYAIRPYLSLRILPMEDVPDPNKFITRIDLEGTYTVLILDLPNASTANKPDAPTPVQKSIFDHWKKEKAEVFRVAQANVDSQKVEKVTKTSEIQGTLLEVTVLTNENIAASYALDLARNSPDLIGEWGSAIAMPNKGLVTLCKISRDKPMDFVKYIQLTKGYMERSYQEHPQRISDQYYWYYQGTFTRIPVTTDTDGNPDVIVPQGLKRLIAATSVPDHN
jgi:hypothetical protein